MDIGNLLEELLIKCNKKIYLLFGNKWIDVLDANGNLNIRIKNIVNSGIPTSSSSNGFYYDGINVYIKAGSEVINMTESNIPEGSIVLYNGLEAPNGWYKYADSNKFDGVIYITNKRGINPLIIDVTLKWNPSTNPITATLGKPFNSPILEKIVSGNIPLIIDYSSSDTSKATIDSNGNVTLKAVGLTIIKAETKENLLHKAASTSYTLIISEPEETVINVSSISINPSTFTINAGESKTFNAIINPSDATNKVVTWSISGPGSLYLTKSESGLSCTITATSIINEDSSAIITVTSNDGNKQSNSTIIIKNNYVEPEEPDPEIIPFGDSGIWMKHNIISDSGEEYFTYDEAIQEAAKYISLGWRIPTLEDYLKLVNSVVGDQAWMNLDGKLGYLLTDENGNDVFFPARGYYYYFNGTYLPLEGVNTQARYWSSTSDENNNKLTLLGNLGYVLNTVTKISPNNKLTLRLCKDKNTNPEDEQHTIDVNYNENFSSTSPRLTGIEGNTFNLPTLYIKENNTTYTLDNYPYKNLLNITYKFEQDNDINYASIDSNTGIITLNHSTTGDGIRVGAYVNGNGIFNDCDAHFYVSILRSGVRPDQDEPLYSVGLLSDVHYATRKDVNRPITTKSDGNSSSSTTGNTYSYYLEDLNYLIKNVFLDADFIASPGDITEYNINDLIVFTTGYKSAYNNNPKPFYCATGNHDHGIIYCVGNTRAQDSNGSEIGDSTGGRWNSITYGGTTYPCPGSLATTISGLSKSNFYSGSKSYYISYKGDMYIFMMADYGSTNGMSDVHPHNMISSSQITTLKSKISNYTFPDNESNLNFLYYKYEDLIKLEELLRTNSSKRIFIFSHYFLPHKAGGGNKYQPGESTELMGITFHFLNYLNNTYTNTIWFSGHTHISWLDNTVKGLHWTNTNYDYIKPTSSDNSSMTYNDNLGLCKISGTNKIYNRNGSNKLNNNPTAWNIHLPSMSRPVNTSGKQLGNCEAAIMRVYDDRVEIEKVGYSTSNGSSYTQYNIPDSLLTIYNDGTGECNDSAPEISESGGEVVPSVDSITIRITNSTNKIVRLNGKFVFNIINGLRTSQMQAYVPEYNGGYDNQILINPGGTYTGTVNSLVKEYTDSPEPSEFLSGSWNLNSLTNAIYIYSTLFYGTNSANNRKDGEPHGSNGMYTPSTVPNKNIKAGETFDINITGVSSDANNEQIYPDEILSTTHYYVLGPGALLRRGGVDYTIVKGDPTGNSLKSGVINTA